MELQHENAVITVEKMSVTYRSDSCTVQRYEDELGECVVAYHRVFPGILFSYKEFRRQNCILRIQTPTKNVLVIEHCREGRVECPSEENYFYLEAGDIAIRWTDGTIRDISFPANHYHGIDIMIDIEQIPCSLDSIFEKINISPSMLVEKFRMEDNSYHFLRQNPHVEHIFSELYSIPDSVKEGYLKIKVLEVLLFLHGLELEEIAPATRRLSPGQVRLAREVHQYLTEHLTKHITNDQLARHFNTSATQLKDSFRRAYGTSIQTFVSERRMQSAAELLRETDRKVADIAAEFGYANASKFAAAFQRVMGETPTKYRLKQRIT